MMQGSPCLIFLIFCPIAGMDPIAKRFMWEVISHLSTRRGKTAVILTTHSMNEAQALCTRIGIMVQWCNCSLSNFITCPLLIPYPPYSPFECKWKWKVGGRLRCIGSPQHLKTRFGNHLELEVFISFLILLFTQYVYFMYTCVYIYIYRLSLLK